MRIASFDQWQDFMKGIATANKTLNPGHLAESKNFYAFSEEIVGTSLNFPSMLLMPEAYSIKDNVSDNIHLGIHPEFWISFGVAAGDPAAEKEALKVCFDLTWDILSYIKEEAHPFGYVADKSINELDLNAIQFEEHQPFGIDRAIGYRVQLSFFNPKQLTKSNNWW